MGAVLVEEVEFLAVLFRMALVLFSKDGLGVVLAGFATCAAEDACALVSGGLGGAKTGLAAGVVDFF